MSCLTLTFGILAETLTPSGILQQEEILRVYPSNESMVLEFKLGDATVHCTFTFN